MNGDNKTGFNRGPHDPEDPKVISDGPHEPNRSSFDSEVVGLAECIRRIADLQLVVNSLERRIEQLESRGEKP